MGFLRQCSQLSKLLKRKIETIGGVLLYFLIIASGFVPYGLETFGAQCRPNRIDAGIISA